MEDRLNKGEYATFLEFAAAMAMGWMVVGDSVFARLLTQRERDTLSSKEAASELEELALNYMKELRHDS